MPVPTASTVEFLALESAASADAEVAAAAQVPGSDSAASNGAALPAGWSTQVSKSTGNVYFVNTYTNETTYDRPTEPAVPEMKMYDELEPDQAAIEPLQEQTAHSSAQEAQSEAALPLGWESVTSRSTGQTYYHNLSTGETTYDLPDKPAMTAEEWRNYLDGDGAR